MKTRRFWLHFISHERESLWLWKPSLIKSQIIYNLSGKMWLAPHIEFAWLFIVFQWTFYSKKKEYGGNYFEDECPAEMMQDRINVLENAIRKHKKNIKTDNAAQADLELWSILN